MRAACIFAALFASAITFSADYVTQTFKAAKPKTYTATSRYPAFTCSCAPAKLANAAVKKAALQHNAGFVKEAKQSWKESKRPDMPNLDYTMGFKVASCTEKLISLTMYEEYYLGGAHGAHAIYTFNFGKKGALKLADLFKKGTNCKKLVSGIVIEKLKHNDGAMWVASGEVKEMSAEQFERFTAGKNGLTFYFNEYEMGPYSSGSFEIPVSFKELGAAYVGVK